MIEAEDRSTKLIKPRKLLYSLPMFAYSIYPPGKSLIIYRLFQPHLYTLKKDLTM